MIHPAVLRRQYDELCKAESSKDGIIKNLFEYIEDLEEKLQIEKNEVDSQRRAVISLRDERNEFKAQMEDLVAEKFQNRFIQDGKKGGHDAAQALIHAVQEHIKEIDPKASPIISCNIRVYSNLQGLAKVYRETGILRPDQDLSAFIRGFNMESPLCDFVDAGLFAEDINNIHCRRIIFCASADSGYVRVLGPHRGSRRISLVKGPPFPREMAELAASLETVTFSDVFKSSKLLPPVRRSSSQDTASPAITSTNMPAIVPNHNSILNYASAAKAAAAATIAPTKDSNTKSKSKPRLSVCLNARNQRIDSVLKKSSKEAIAALKSRKLCNQFHILGYCHNMAMYGNCTHEHGTELSIQELNDLMRIARWSPCFSGLMCRDVNCISGHQCPYQDHCTYKGDCKFKDTHNVDTVIVSTLEV
ncbi:CCCH zinc finger DNA binding protein [Aspergillus foveolatus]|uniref:CCCH zinc finger DNA binding protein n=1 Tax=Aspergillus foveolatus TaxID=210207 RepID=UPI003CCCEF23